MPLFVPWSIRLDYLQDRAEYKNMSSKSNHFQSFVQTIIVIILSSSLSFSVLSLSATATPTQLSGNWFVAKQSLRDPNCCVVSIAGLESHVSTIQQYFCGDDAPDDLDLRTKVRCKNVGSNHNMAYDDCKKIYIAVMQNDKLSDCINNNHPCISALEELARGVASLADGPLEGTCTDVHMRIVCASNYKAIDPMFHSEFLIC